MAACLPGEKAMYWVVERADGSPQILPKWWSIPIMETITQWCQQRDEWQMKIAAAKDRGKELSQQKQAQYEQWEKKGHVRNIVFNLRYRRVWTNFTKAHEAHLRKHALLVEIKLSPELQIRSGKLDWMPLKCVRIDEGPAPTIREMPSDWLPENHEMEHAGKLGDQEEVPVRQTHFQFHSTVTVLGSGI